MLTNCEKRCWYRNGCSGVDVEAFANGATEDGN